ncbi:MAG: DUF308 domain-containing protein [Eubacteriales bacterium]
MKITEAIKNFKWGYIVLFLILCGAGVALLFYPGESMKAMAYIVGFSALLLGILQGVRILAEPRRGIRFAFAILLAVMTIVCGAVALLKVEVVYEVYAMFIGLFIIIDGSFKLQTVIESKRYQMSAWWILLAFSVLSIAGGFLTVRIPFDADRIRFFTLLLGGALFVDGLQNLLSLFYLGKLSRAARAMLLAGTAVARADGPDGTAEAQAEAPSDADPTV